MAKGSDLVSVIAAIALNAIKSQYADGRTIGQGGYIVPGSWDPATGEVDVLVGETAAMLPDATEQALSRQRCSLVTTAHGHQTGPVGGERVTLIPTDEGYEAIMTHGADDSPGAPAGESWHTHKSGSFIKLLNSGNVDLNAVAIAAITAPTITIGPLGSTQYAVIRTVDLMALITALNDHVHGPGTGGDTGPPVVPFVAPAGSPDVTCG